MSDATVQSTILHPQLLKAAAKIRLTKPERQKMKNNDTNKNEDYNHSNKSNNKNNINMKVKNK